MNHEDLHRLAQECRDNFRCVECEHTWNCIDATVRPPTECPNCGHEADSLDVLRAAALEGPPHD